MPPRKGATRKAAAGSTRKGNGRAAQTADEAGQSTTRSLRSKASEASGMAAGTDEEPEPAEPPGVPPAASRKTTPSVVDVQPGTPRHPAHSKATPRASHAPPGEGRGAAKRQVFTPLFGRKYTRGTVDVPLTPRRATGAQVGTPADAARVAVSMTPYTAKRAIADYEAEKDPIKTYVRLKPADPALFAGALPKSLLQVVSDKEVEVVRAATDEALCERYLFAGVLPSLAKQPRMFEVCGLPVVSDLFAGYNTLLFTYGITNSGKTYTVQGTAGSPGMLPRSIKAILEVLDARGLQGDFPIRPKYATQVEYCSDPRIVSPTFRVAPGEDAWVSGLELDDPLSNPKVAEIVRRLEEDAGDQEWAYQLYVSYFEVYNEMVYDLLDLATLTTVHVKSPYPDDSSSLAGGRAGRGRGRGRGRRTAGRGRKRAGLAADDPDDPLSMSASQIAALPRNALLLRSEGGRGNEAFVDGVTEVRVRSVRDLVRVLIHGQMRRSVHATGLNVGSSRSHALFQAKLVKVRRDAQIVPLSAVPSEAQVSVRTLTVVDLAGSERAKRTMNQGDRLAEAGKINVSLMTLKKCLDVRRYNASLDPLADAQLVPYNESKVTRLFQPAFEGGAKTIMVVCIDPYEQADAADPRRASMAGPSHSFTEAKNVLDFARVASSLVARVRRVDDPSPAYTPARLRAAESPTRAGHSVGAGGLLGALHDDEDDEDEIFFDTQIGREAAGVRSRKRSSSVLCVDVGVQTEEAALAATAKRQRKDLGGDWQHPPPVAAAASPFRQPGPSTASRPAPPPPAMASEQSPGMWGAITKDSTFSFELSPERLQQDAPLLLTQALAAGSEHKREIQRLRGTLTSTQAKLSAVTSEKEAEAEELVRYADALEAAVNELRQKYVDAQERVLRIEEETRAETSQFFMGKIAQIQELAADRLQDELALSEIKSAHKIDILSRLRTISGLGDSDDESEGLNAAEVPTVSPRTALRRAVSRAASKKANKYASVSAGDNREIGNLRAMVESLEAQVSSQSTQLEMIGQARTADRSRNEALEAALVEANGRGASLEARLMRLSSVHSAEAELAITRAHERERAEFLAQITMLKAQLRESETHSMRARRKWETQELLPVQERLRMMMSSASAAQASAASAGTDMAEALERAEKDRDSAWEWWTREQERNSQLCAQNDVLMREIRHLRGQIQEKRAHEVVIHAESMSDSDDDSFCKVSLKSIDTISAINGGNPIGATIMDAAPSQTSFGASVMSGAKPMASLDRVLSKGRVLHRNLNAKTFGPTGRDSTESFAASPSRLSPPAGAHEKRAGRAKRVVSKVLHNFTPNSKRRGDAPRPYMAGRFATTDTAVGNYAKEIFTFEDGRARGNTLESIDSVDPQQSRVRSIVYSGPMIKHATGGVSVTFTSEEVHDLTLGTETIPEHPEEEMEIPLQEGAGDEQRVDGNAPASRSSSSLGVKRARAMLQKPVAGHSESDTEMADAGADAGADAADGSGREHGNAGDESEEYASEGSADELPTPPPGTSAAMSSSMPTGQLSPGLVGIPSVTSLQSTVKKKRKLHAGRTVMDIEAPDNEFDSHPVAAPRPPRQSATGAGSQAPSGSGAVAWASPPSLASFEPSSGHPKVARAAQPQENKQPVLFTPVRTRSRGHTDESSPLDGSALDAHGRDKQESIFTTPMKMLNRLRNRKK